MSKKAFIISTRDEEDYDFLAVCLDQYEATRWINAYNDARESPYRAQAAITEVDLHEPGDPLPRAVTVWHGVPHQQWSSTEIVTNPSSLVPQVINYGTRPHFAHNYPTAQAVKDALEQR
jgi:hypothetical protein